MNEIDSYLRCPTAVGKLNYFRNRNYTDGNATIEGIIANAINDILPEYVRLLTEKQARDEGCGYCQNDTAEIAHTHTTNLLIDTFGKARTLVTECNPCPPYADCCSKNMISRSVFLINYCPMCGRKLEKEERRCADGR